MPREACCRHVLYRVVELMADLPSQGSLEIGAELRCRVARNRLYTCVYYICSSWYQCMGDETRVLTCNNVQARRPVAEIRTHDDSEVWSRASAVPLLERADNGSRHLAGASGGAKGADFPGS